MENKKDLLIDLTTRLVQIDSSLPNTDDWPTQGQKDALAEFENICKELGFEVTIAPNGSWGYAEIGSGEKMIGILGHLDVVPPGDMEEWKSNPFELKVDGDFMYGRGVIDDKGPVAASMVTMKSILDSGIELNKRIRLIVSTDEEILWRGMSQYTKTQELPYVAFTPDSSFSITYAEKDLLQLHIKGVGTDKFNFEYNGALNVVPGKVEYKGDRLDDIKSIATKKGFKFEEKNESIFFIGEQKHAKDAVGKTNALVNLVNSLPEDLDEIPVIKFIKENIDHGEATKIFGNIEDEPTGKLTFNMAKLIINNEKTQISVDSRIPVEAYKIDEYEKTISTKAEEYGLKYERFDYLPPVYFPLDSELIKSMMTSYTKITGRTDQPVSSGGATFARAIPNCLAFGPKLPDEPQTEHMPNEQANIPNMIKAIDVYYDFLTEELKK